MFKKFAAEALGLSDIGIIVPPSDYDKVDADDYLFHEDHERIFFLIKSKKDEYCFTNLAFIHVDGESAVSSKRSIRRYPWSTSLVQHVAIETAGTIDLDVELKFHIGEQRLSIDVRKNFIEALKDIYKALTSIGHQQARETTARQNALHCAQIIGSMFKLNTGDTDTVTRQYHSLVDAVNHSVLDKHLTRDFGSTFEKYIKA
ncbi:MAG: PH domain-containing protein [Gemmatimonadaceae bacterium]|nr:PH domain-containing protein [Gemmatimonadaceae bacterium]